MGDVQISCIIKSDRTNPHERIQSVGGINPDGTGWILPEADAIAGIKNGTWRFWTTGGGKSVWVIIEKSAAGNEYLKTEPDGVVPDNLLSLPRCP